jgi:hypothetical protein
VIGNEFVIRKFITNLKHNQHATDKSQTQTKNSDTGVNLIFQEIPDCDF